MKKNIFKNIKNNFDYSGQKCTFASLEIYKKIYCLI